MLSRSYDRLCYVVDPLRPFVTALKQADSLPFLFVGSGVSRRYLGYADWNGLLEWAASMTDKPLQYYLGQSQDYPKCATAIANAFYDRWWNDSKYAQSRDQWQDQCLEPCSPLKVMVAERLAKPKVTKSKALREELKLLADCKVDGIITTNYDTLLEHTFPAFTVFVGEQDLLLRRSYQLEEIYKIHGSVDAPNTMVLCEDDYRRFDVTSTYLVAKLMSVFVEHPIVFLGYSLNDRNMRVVLTSLAKCLGPKKLAEFKSRFIWIEWDDKARQPVVDDFTLDLGDTRLLPVMRIRTASYAPVYRVLAGLERKVSLGLLRRIEQQVVELVHSADPTRLLQVSWLADLSSLPDEALVVAVGPAPGSTDGKSYIAYDRNDIIYDTVEVNPDLNKFDKTVEETLPRIMHQSPNAWLPVFKYVRLSQIADADLPTSVRAAMARTIGNAPGKEPPGAAAMTIRQLVKTYGLDKALDIVWKRDPADVDADELQAVLQEHKAQAVTTKGVSTTAYARAAVMLDYIRYGPHSDSRLWLPHQRRGRKRARRRSSRLRGRRWPHSDHSLSRRTQHAKPIRLM